MKVHAKRAYVVLCHMGPNAWTVQTQVFWFLSGTHVCGYGDMRREKTTAFPMPPLSWDVLGSAGLHKNGSLGI